MSIFQDRFSKMREELNVLQSRFQEEDGSDISEFKRELCWYVMYKMDRFYRDGIRRNAVEIKKWIADEKKVSFPTFAELESFLTKRQLECDIHDYKDAQDIYPQFKKWKESQNDE